MVSLTDNVYCLAKIIQKDERIIAAVQFKIKLFDFFSTCLNIGQTRCSYEHYLVLPKIRRYITTQNTLHSLQCYKSKSNVTARP